MKDFYFPSFFIRIFFIIFLIGAPLLVGAKGDEGSQVLSTDRFLVVMSHTPIELAVGRDAVFSWHLIERENEKVFRPAVVLVRLRQGETTLVSAKLLPSDQTATLNYSFFVGGDYQVEVRFEDDSGAVLANTDFTLQVKGGEGQSVSGDTSGQAEESPAKSPLIIALLFGAVVGWFLCVRRRKNSGSHHSF